MVRRPLRTVDDPTSGGGPGEIVSAAGWGRGAVDAVGDVGMDDGDALVARWHGDVEGDVVDHHVRRVVRAAQRLNSERRSPGRSVAMTGGYVGQEASRARASVRKGLISGG